MKRTAVLLLILIAVCSMTSCQKNENEISSQKGNAEVSVKDVGADKSSEAAGSEDVSSDEPEEQKNVLIAYFSRWGNTSYPDDIDANTSASIVVKGDEQFGTTEYMARLIQEVTDGDIHLIQTAQQYPADFDELTDQNHDEMENNFIPELIAGNLDISQYDTIFIGYPVWATDVPQAVISFLNEYDLSNKTVIPFCTHDGYGAGGSYVTIRELSNAAAILDGFAIEAKDVPEAKDAVKDWLDSIGMEKNTEAAIKIMIGDSVLDGVIYNTALAQEIKEELPLEVSMAGYGNREYYGGIDFTPVNTDGGQLHFEDGDITYCSTNNTIAIFYAQTDHPDLTMEVIPIGKVTSDLSVFETFGSQEDVIFSLMQ